MNEPGLLTSTVDAPVPSYCLEKKSKEFPVISSIVSSVLDDPAISSTFGLKSALSLNGNCPTGDGESGSTFVALYVGMYVLLHGILRQAGEGSLLRLFQSTGSIRKRTSVLCVLLYNRSHWYCNWCNASRCHAFRVHTIIFYFWV